MLLQSAQIALSALIDAMKEIGKVALVLRVYQRNSKVMIGVLSPQIELNYEVFSYSTFHLVIILFKLCLSDGSA